MRLAIIAWCAIMMTLYTAGIYSQMERIADNTEKIAMQALECGKP